MAAFDRELVLAVDAQAVEGTVNATIAALSNSIDLSDGVVLGDPDSGLFRSGITHSFTRRERTPEAIADSFTRTDGDFLEEEVSLSFAFALCGNRVDTVGSPDDDDFDHEKGIDALLACCGLDGAASGANPVVGWKYTPADVSLASIKIFDSGAYWVLRDVRGDITFELTPGEVAVATCTLQGIVDSAGVVTFPTVDYEEQASVAAPSVVETATAWSATRGFLECSIAVKNNLEKAADSNSDVGYLIEQNGREITVDMTIRDDSSDVDYTRTNLVQAIAATDDLVFQVGDAAAAAAPAIAYQVECANLRVLSYTPAVAGKKAASQVSAVCTGLTDGSEFFLAFL